MLWENFFKISLIRKVIFCVPKHHSSLVITNLSLKGTKNTRSWRKGKKCFKRKTSQKRKTRENKIIRRKTLKSCQWDSDLKKTERIEFGKSFQRYDTHFLHFKSTKKTRLMIWKYSSASTMISRNDTRDLWWSMRWHWIVQIKFY